MSFFGPSLVWHQRRQASLLESNLRLVKGGSREPEGSRRSAYLLSLALDPAQHLVFDLDEISGIEEFVGQEQFVADLLGVGIQRPLLAKG